MLRERRRRRARPRSRRRPVQRRALALATPVAVYVLVRSGLPWLLDRIDDAMAGSGAASDAAVMDPGTAHMLGLFLATASMVFVVNELWRGRTSAGRA